MLSASDFWFLDVAVRGMPGVRQVADTPEQLRLRFNVFPHTLERTQAVDVLFRLFQEGAIYFARCGDKLTVSRDDLMSTVVSATARNSPDIHFGLTESGGERWESAAQPNWSQYYDDNYDSGEVPEETVVELSASNDVRLCELFSFYSDTFLDTQQSYDQLEKERISPWQATYWKVLPQGVRLRCVGTPKLLAVDELRHLEEYFRNARGQTMQVWRRYGTSLNESESLYRDGRTKGDGDIF